MDLLGDMGQMLAHFVPFGDSVDLHIRLVHHLCRTCSRLRNPFWADLTKLLGDVGQMEARFGFFGDSANLDAILVHGLRQTYSRFGNHFVRTRWNS
jgi:hypothetical protein